MILLAMDRAPAGSVRSFDADGRLHVSWAAISKANVCPYLGREIPGHTELGLDPDRVYNLLRCPEEMTRGLSTFNNLPLLSEHVPVSSEIDDGHMPDLIVGSTGTDAAFDGEYLSNSLVVWAKDSIDGVVNDEKRQLSSAYRYRADMTPGNFGGIAYDGVMRDIVGNHVALVIQGRAGPDVIVGDEQPMKLTKRALMLSGGLAAVIRPHLAQDAKLDLSSALASVTDKGLSAKGAGDALANVVFGLVQPQLAADAALNLETVRDAVAAVIGLTLAEDDDLEAGEANKAEDADDDEDDKGASDADDDEDDKGAADADDDEDDKPAMDSATVTRMIDKAQRDARAESKAIRTAEREVAPIVGEVVAMDSAAAVYRLGLEALGVDLNGLPRSAYGATFRAVANKHGKTNSFAQDSRVDAGARADFDKRFANKLPKLIRG